jgi:hypothetical protein
MAPSMTTSVLPDFSSPRSNPKCCIAEQHSAPLDVIFDGLQAAAELEPVDRTMAFALLIGPLAFGRISTLTEFDYQAVGIAAVDGFLKCFAKDAEITRASSESAGA